MQTSLHINFNGQCGEALRYDERSLGGKTEFLMPYEGAPGDQSLPPEWGKKVLHASLRIAGQVLMGCDAPPNWYEQPRGFSVSLSFKEEGEAERAFHALADDGHVRMPLQEYPRKGSSTAHWQPHCSVGTRSWFPLLRRSCQRSKTVSDRPT